MNEKGIDYVCMIEERFVTTKRFNNFGDTDFNPNCNPNPNDLILQ